MLSTLTPETNVGENQPVPDSGVTYCLVHGSWHGAWCWELLRPELEAAGHMTMAMDLPIDDPRASYETYADIVAEHIDDPGNTVVVGHSRAGNVLPRVASRKSVRQLIYLSAGFDPNNDRWLRHHYFAPVPEKYDPDFQRGLIRHEGSEFISYDPDAAMEFFYHDCTDEVAASAAAHLRPMYRPPVQPPIRKWPRTASSFIYTEHDRVIRPDYFNYISRSERIARSLAQPAIKLAGSHSIFLSRPKELAEAISTATIRVTKK